jgi:hypothetical protein
MEKVARRDQLANHDTDSFQVTLGTVLAVIPEQVLKNFLKEVILWF